MNLRVTAIREEAEGIRSFELRDPEGAELPAFEAGAHVQVSVTLPDGRVVQRPYSLLGDPLDRSRYRIAVRLETDGRGGSRFMHERIDEGSDLRVAPPENAFPLREAPHTLLIAGGIGITPILSMVRTLSRRGRSYELHYMARTTSRMAFRQELEAIAGARTHFYITNTTPSRTALAGVLRTPTSGTHAYVCGPPEMIRAVTARGERAGWPAHHIHVERFGPQSRAGDRAIDVYLERSALTLHVGPGESILDAVLSAGVWAPYECQRGACASCMTRVVAGSPDHRDSCLSEALRDRYMCTCVSRAHSDHLTLDL